MGPRTKKKNEFPKTYGLKTTNTPPPMHEMAEFEKEPIDFVQKLKFKKHTVNDKNDCKKTSKESTIPTMILTRLSLECLHKKSRYQGFTYESRDPCSLV